MSEYITEWVSHNIEDPFVREEIVRCGNCLSWFKGECRKHVFTITVDDTEYDEGAFPMDASDFCSLGEPRGDEE